MLMFVGKCKVDIPKIENREREQKGGGGRSPVEQSYRTIPLQILVVSSADKVLCRSIKVTVR